MLEAAKLLTVSITFDKLCEVIRSEKAQVVRCWHPEAVGELLALANGANAEVKIGPAAYQISAGSIITEF